MAKTNKILLLLLLVCHLSSFANTISTLPLPQNNFCAGSPVTISFSVSGVFNAGNTFTAELSNATGNFSSPTLIGAVNGTASGNIACIIPAGMPQGTGYRIRVSGSSPVVTGTDNGLDVTINTVPSVSLNPISDLCEGSSAFALSGGIPTGGTYSGTGVIGNSFYPTLVNSGSYTITYFYTDINGCSGSASTNLNVNPAPTVNLNITGNFCSNGASSALTGGTPAGGTYSGNGVTGNLFNPQQAGAGNHTITYVYADPVTTCSASASQSIFVQSVPTVIFNIPSAVCENASPVNLSAVPSGGIFSGPGVSGSVFNPASAGNGTHSISYTVNVGNGCASSASQNIIVNALPVVTFSPLNNQCEGSTSFPLNGGNPVGGVYSGTGVVNGSFFPSLSGAGTFSILYVFSDINGCQSSASQNITIHPNPTVTFSPPQTSCVGGIPVNLTANPSGGTFSGTGVSGNTFNPQVAGIGTWVLSYDFTDSNGCSASASAPVTVVSFGTAAISPVSPVCQNDGSVLLNCTPAGGILSGPGIQNGVFNPAAAGAGTHQIIYTISSGNGCSSADTISIIVHPVPQVLLNTQTEYCSNGGGQILSGGIPLGGTYSGQGVINGSFFPSAAGVGNTIINYAYTDINGCSSSSSATISVYQAPSPSLAAFQPVCVNAADFLLSGGLPTGGVYTGTGVSNNIFSPTVSGPGFFQITYTLTDTNNCSESAGGSLQVYNLSLDAGADDTISCGNSVQLQPNLTYNGTGALTYSWTPSIGLSASNILAPQATPTTTTTYVLTISDGSCSVTDSVTIFVGDANFGLAFTQNQQVFTQPPFAVTFINNTPSLGNYTFTWLMGDGTQIINNSQIVTYQYFNDGIYDVTLIAVDNATGCTDTLFRPQWISCSGNCTHLAQINQTGPLTVCNGSAVTLTCNTDPTFDSYQWYFNGLPIMGADTSFFDATQQGFYSVSISDNGCVRVSSSILVQVLTTPPTPSISIISTLNPCSGNPAVLSTAAGYQNYNWRRVGDPNILPSATSTISTAASGFYNVSVFDGNGCSSTSPDFPLNYSFLFPGELCIVTYNTVDNNGQNTIVWDQPVTNTISAYKILRETNAANVYDTIGTVAYGALSEYVDTDPAYNPNISAYSYRLALVDTCGGTTLPGGRHRTMHLTINSGLGGNGQQVWNLIWSSYEGLSFGTYYIYRTNDSLNLNWTLIGSVAAGSNPFNSFSDINPPVGYNGYQVIIEMPAPCESVERAQYNKTRSNVGQNLTIAGTREDEKAGSIQIYPNPNSGTATMFVNGLIRGTAAMTVCDMFGRTVYNEVLQISGQEHQLNLGLEELSSGLYQINIVQDRKLITKKLVINK
jgi:hypothetical protein